MDPPSVATVSPTPSPPPPPPAPTPLPCSIALYGDHLAWLTLLQQRYSLPSPSSTLSRLLSYIASLPPSLLRPVFTIIRCKHCGLRFPPQPHSFDLPSDQWEWVVRMRDEWRVVDEGKVVRIVLDYAQWGARKRGMKDVDIAQLLNDLEHDIFTVDR
jgi:hypothetical protein